MDEGNSNGRSSLRWRRVVLKLSGEALASSASDETIDASTVNRLAAEIATSVADLGVELAIVIGGGNIWRGTIGAGEGMDRATSDTMGMLGTVINALALQDAIERQGQPTRVLTRPTATEMAAATFATTARPRPTPLKPTVTETAPEMRAMGVRRTGRAQRPLVSLG